MGLRSVISRVLKLAEHDDQTTTNTPPVVGVHRLLMDDALFLSDQSQRSTVTLLRVGSWDYPTGRFAVTSETLRQLVENFNRNVYRQSVFIDVEHQPRNGAAGEIKKLYTDGTRLLADVEWTSYGIDANRQRKHIYLSAEYSENYIDRETGQSYGPTLFGAGLVTRPHVKGLPPIHLHEQSTTKNNMNKFLQRLLAALASSNAPKKLSESLVASFTAESAKLGDDESRLQMLTDAYIASADAAILKLAEDGSSQPVSVSVNLGMSDADLDKLLVKKLGELEAQRVAAQQKQTETLTAKRKLFTDAIHASALSDEQKRELSEHTSVINAEMADDGVKALAESYIKIYRRDSANAMLAGMGFNVAGSTRISVDETNKVKKLQETVDTALRLTPAFANRRLVLSNDQTAKSAFINQVLEVFDRANAQQLQSEYRVLAENATTQTPNLFLPASFQRTVIREALSDLKILQLVQTLVDAGATMTTMIPYEERWGGTIPNDGIVYESQGINSAGVTTKYDTAYVNAMKLALRLSNEVIHFSNAGMINWAAWAENIDSNARIMKELIHRRVANEMLRASDTVSAIAVANEVMPATDATGIAKTTKYPIVRPAQVRDMKGNAVGNPECPVVVLVAGAPINQWLGDIKAASGKYWSLNNLNLGYVQILEHTTGTSPIAAVGVVATISYYMATNLLKFDIKPPTGIEFKKHLNGLLDAIGDQKSMLSSRRFVQPDYALMSDPVNNLAAKADQFVISLTRQGTTTDTAGDLQAIKSLPAFSTNAPGIDIGDNRILMGQRNLTTYTIAKPYSVGQPFEAVDTGGRPTGEKIAYGEEYNAIYTPHPVRNRYTSVLIYDSGTR